MPPPPNAITERDRSRRHHGRRHMAMPHITPPPPPPDQNAGDRITGEDLQTWLLAYEQNLDVYICANKFLMEDFKREVARVTIDMLETAGSDAAVPEVLRLCRKLYQGLSEVDPLLKMIFARVGFLQPVLWGRDAEDTSQFLVCHPEVAALILRETASRRQDDIGGGLLPSMERPWFPRPPADLQFMPRMYRGPPTRWA